MRKPFAPKASALEWCTCRHPILPENISQYFDAYRLRGIKENDNCLSMKKPGRYIDLMDKSPPWYCWGEPTLEREGKRRQKWWWTQTENVRKNYPHSKAAFTVKMISHKIIKWRIVPSPEWPSPSTHQRETSGRRLGACSPAPILKQF